jgi:hypothetical protein
MYATSATFVDKEQLKKGDGDKPSTVHPPALFGYVLFGGASRRASFKVATNDSETFDDDDV